MRVNDAATLVVDEMIRDDGKRESGAASASPSDAPAQQEDTCKDLGGRRNLASSRQHMQAPPVK